MGKSKRMLSMLLATSMAFSMFTGVATIAIEPVAAAASKATQLNKVKSIGIAENKTATNTENGAIVPLNVTFERNAEPNSLAKIKLDISVGSSIKYNAIQDPDTGEFSYEYKAKENVLRIKPTADNKLIISYNNGKLPAQTYKNFTFKVANGYAAGDKEVSLKTEGMSRILCKLN